MGVLNDNQFGDELARAFDAIPYEDEDFGLDFLKMRSAGMTYVKPLSISSLTRTEEALRDTKAVTEGAIQVVRREGKHYIKDGHHRTALAAQAGHSQIEAEILPYDEEDW